MRYVYEIPVCDTFMLYWYAIRVWDTGMRYVYKIHWYAILLCDTRMGYHWDTCMRYVYEIPVCDTHMRYWYAIRVWDTGMWYVYKIHWYAIPLCDTRIGYHYAIPVWGSQSLMRIRIQNFWIRFQKYSNTTRTRIGCVENKKQIIWKFLELKLPQNFFLNFLDLLISYNLEKNLFVSFRPEFRRM